MILFAGYISALPLETNQGSLIKSAAAKPIAGLNARHSFDLKSIIKFAYENNPAIQAARLKWQSVIERYPSTKSWPDPMLMYSYFPSPLETRLGPQRHRISLSQAIPYPGKTKL